MRLKSRNRVACLGLVGLIVGCDGGDVASVEPGPPPAIENAASKAKRGTRSAQNSTPADATQLSPK